MPLTPEWIVTGQVFPPVLWRMGLVWLDVSCVIWGRGW